MPRPKLFFLKPLLVTSIRRLTQTAKEPVLSGAALTVITNPYQAKKVWPPKMTELTPQQQLRFEKKMKRRLRLVYHRPKWDKAVLLVQYTFMVACVVSFVFFSDFEFWCDEYRPSDEMRKYVQTVFGTMDPDKRFEGSLHSFPREQSTTK
ncbi:hypothetical protein CDD80_1624 [Ophiocordyceps camponoti-rufipedis]|uniref:Uncharacterized protein n=1 Tax=Ophiocordyceps camponoti-rufipedis TaxID=2004952 RepID=A0A2C5ZKU4_9HYPO|nr:hypothetical protein CDD80_1624 [Ophiocordyceps camponoti-rufipedis]